MPKVIRSKLWRVTYLIENFSCCKPSERLAAPGGVFMHTVSSLRFFTMVGRLSRRSFALTLAALFGGTGLFLTFYNNLTLPIVYGVSTSFPGEPLRAFRLLNTASSLIPQCGAEPDLRCARLTHRPLLHRQYCQYRPFAPKGHPTIHLSCGTFLWYNDKRTIIVL